MNIFKRIIKFIENIDTGYNPGILPIIERDEKTTQIKDKLMEKQNE
jgi:hypothetical protein